MTRLLVTFLALCLTLAAVGNRIHLEMPTVYGANKDMKVSSSNSRVLEEKDAFRDLHSEAFKEGTSDFADSDNSAEDDVIQLDGNTMDVRHGMFIDDTILFQDADDDFEEFHDFWTVDPAKDARFHSKEITTEKPVVLFSNSDQNHVKTEVSDNQMTFTFPATTSQMDGPPIVHVGEVAVNAKMFRQAPVMKQEEAKETTPRAVPHYELPNPKVIHSASKHSNSKVLHIRSPTPDGDEKSGAPAKNCSRVGTPCRRHAECCAKYCQYYTMTCEFFYY